MPDTLSTRTRLSWALLSTAALAACGGGGGGGSTPAPAPTDALDQAEAEWVQDPDATYDVLVDDVLQGHVITRDKAPWTFADVNADIDDTDLVTPEIDAHIWIEGLGSTTELTDDGLASNATIRLRGHSSRLAAQKSYRIKLANSAGAWRAEKTLQFNKHPWDLSRVRNKLAMDLFHALPHMPSLRTQFVRLDLRSFTLAGTEYAATAGGPAEDFGLFTHVEKMGKEYLAARSHPTGAATMGNIYKAESFSFSVADTTTLKASLTSGAVTNKAQFETVLSLEADNGNHLRLIAMLDELANLPDGNDAAFEAFFARYFDRANYLTWMATAVLMGNRDTINQNFALYQPKVDATKAGTDKFYFLPWDYDGAFDFEHQPDQVAAGRLYGDWQLSVGNWWNVPLHRRFLSSPSRLTELKNAVERIHNDTVRGVNATTVQALLTRYTPRVQPRVSAAPDVNHLPTSSGGLAEWQAELDRLAAAPARHRGEFLAGLEAPMPFFQDASVPAGGSQLQLAWDAAVDLQGDAVSYNVELASTPDFSSGTIVTSACTPTATSCLIGKPADGRYYLRVTANDGRGHTQRAFDRSDVAGVKHFGVLTFDLAGSTVTVP